MSINSLVPQRRCDRGVGIQSHGVIHREVWMKVDSDLLWEMLASGWDHQCEPMASGGAKTEGGVGQEGKSSQGPPPHLQSCMYSGFPRPQSGVGVRVGFGGQDRWGIYEDECICNSGSKRQEWGGPGVGPESGFTAKEEPGSAH